MRPSLTSILQELQKQVEAAMEKHAPINSPHEGYSVILEELDELWDHVKADTGRDPEAVTEALHVAAMAVRYVYDLAGFSHDT